MKYTKIVNWIFSIFFIFGAVGYIDVLPLSGTLLIIGILFLPPLTDRIKRSRLSFLSGLRITAILIFLVVASVLFHNNESKLNEQNEKESSESSETISTTESGNKDETNNTSGTALDFKDVTTKDEAAVTGNTSVLKIHFIDVGQGDCTLIESDGKYMLVDAGNNKDSDNIVNYLKSQGVKSLEYVIGTHPHADHIGSLDTVIESFEIGKVIMPNVASNTKTFEEVLTAIDSKGLNITAPKVGDIYALGMAKFTIIGPNGEFGEDLNNWSVGIKLINGNNSIVMCGDAESKGEEAIIKTGIDLKADVLKVGHHGSKTSTSDEFLKAVSPTTAVICVGTGNMYGHPADITMNKLKNKGISLYRTDNNGTVIMTSDGNKITFVSEK